MLGLMQLLVRSTIDRVTVRNSRIADCSSSVEGAGVFLVM